MFSIAHIFTAAQIAGVVLGLVVTFNALKQLYTAWKAHTSVSSYVLNQLTGHALYFAPGGLLLALGLAFLRHTHLSDVLLVGVIVTFLLAMHGLALGFLKDHWVSEALAALRGDISKVATDAEQGVVTSVKNAL